MRPGFWTSSIGKKFLVALTGLVLFGFVVGHMLGNLQIFFGREAINAYAEHLEGLPALVWPVRALLLACLLVHVGLAIRLSFENRRARPVAYAMKKSITASPAARTLLVTGGAVFFFIIFHLAHFTFGAVHPEYFRLADPKGRHDVYSMVIVGFRDPWVAGSYVVAMAFLCVHLSHGIGSLFQSLGASDEKLRPFWSRTAKLAAAAIFVGNCSIVAASFFGLLKLPGKIG